MSKRGASRYDIRSQALVEMGFPSYKDYLESDLWKGIWERVMQRDGRMCRACNRPAVSVHHITYDKSVLMGQDDSQLVSICRGCHKHVEFDSETKLTSTAEIYDRLRRRQIRTKAASRANRKKFMPRCRCCKHQKKQLGRNDICMECYQSGKALRFVEVHGVP